MNLTTVDTQTVWVWLCTLWISYSLKADLIVLKIPEVVFEDRGKGRPRWAYMFLNRQWICLESLKTNDITNNTNKFKSTQITTHGDLAFPVYLHQM